MAEIEPGSVIFFDGECGLCNRFVDFVIRRDKHGVYRFAPLQGIAATTMLPPSVLAELNTMALKTGDKILYRSDAGLQILVGLGGGWKMLAALKIFPRFVRDAVYELVSKYRYRIFGKRATCRIPTPAERALFLE
jgi:predicted DCC family thiol-disulfide oxidoreductase YuxK